MAVLMPKRVKYRKTHLARVKEKATKGGEISFGDFGIKSTTSSYITARQIEASRVAITRYIKKGGKLWVRIFPDQSVTKKPAETRMGSGKGSPEYWVAKVPAGRVLFELAGVKKEIAQEAFRLGSHKLPVKTRFVER